MSDTIISGLIAAFAAIVVALINRPPRTRTSEFTDEPRMPRRVVTASWIVVGLAILLFAFLAPIMIHHDMAGMAVFIIPFATLILAFTSPINALSAISLTLALHAGNLFLGPLANQLDGAGQDVNLFYNQTILAIVFGNAFVVGLICWLRRRALPT